MRKDIPNPNAPVPDPDPPSSPAPTPTPPKKTPAAAVRRSDDPELSPESEEDGEEHQEAPGASRYEYLAKPTVKKKAGGKSGFSGGQASAHEVHHPTGPIGRVVAHFLQDVPDFHYDPGRCERFRALLSEWLELEGTVEDVCEMIDSMTQEKVARDGDPPASLNYFNSALQAGVKTRRAAIAKGETGFHAGIRPASEAPEPPKWKQVHVILVELDAKYGAQANSDTYAKYLTNAGLAEYVLGDERTFGTVLRRLFHNFPESDHEDLPYRLRVALGAPPKARKAKPPEPKMEATVGASEVIEKLKAHFAEVAAERPDMFPRLPVVTTAAEVVGDEVSSLTAEQLLERLDPELADSFRDLLSSGARISVVELRKLVRAQAQRKEA